MAELEGFGFPQWQALAAVFAAEALRRDGRLAEAEALVERGFRVASGAEYWYAVGFAQRTAGLILSDQGRAAEASAKRAEALSTFERIGACSSAAFTLDAPDSLPINRLILGCYFSADIPARNTSRCGRVGTSGSHPITAAPGVDPIRYPYARPAKRASRSSHSLRSERPSRAVPPSPASVQIPTWLVDIKLHRERRKDAWPR